ncbi:CHAT domain-containing protein [Corallococcus sp. BB11-1]|uniref:CHAT domain-containing tetratricopeptide repeat protein n=1 Tax=Corallococcus sp. BB11-1 TaxID=2996783 RepID=UPI002270D695|nr:CHAT domain-containing protein [Corallococcus sp. BB11-1]MCY1034255.1 CHAT domain-containing protein [Corallococcus sp. BB11-1]
MRMLRWMVVVLCCVAGAAGGEPPPDARLQQAQKAFEEATALDKAGKYAEAIVKGEQALALREAVLGSSHPEVATCLNLLGRIYRRQGEYVQAEPLIQRGLTLREETLGKSHPDVAQSLHNLALLYKEQGLYGRAEPMIRRALAIREATLDENHPDVAQAINSLAILYKEQGLYDRAEPLYQRALAIREAALGKNHLDVAQSLHNLAILHGRQGLYSQAEPLIQRALAIQETTLGENHPLVASSLNVLAGLYEEQGLYGQAEPLYQRALAIQEAALGTNPFDIASVLNNLANLYWAQGLYGRAEPLYLRALAIAEAVFGTSHPSVATLVSNLSNLYKEQGSYDQAELFAERALTVREATLGKNHPDVAISLDSLANLYAGQESYDRAAPLYQRALGIREARLGKNHPETATSLDNLANLYANQGLYGRAALLHQRALAIEEKALGKGHPNLAQFLNHLAQVRLVQQRLGEAVALFTRAFAMSEQRLRDEALDFSEARLANFLQYLRRDEDRLHALLRANPDNARVKKLSLGATLLLKGRSVEETADISRAVYRSLGAQEHATFDRLRGLRTQLAQLSFQGPGSLPSAAYQQQLKQLAAQGDALEAELAKRSAPLRTMAALPSLVDIVDRVAAALPGNGALVEFITYEDRPLVPRAGPSKAQLRYLALVLRPDATIRAVDLGPAAPIDAAASNLRDALANRDTTYQAQSQALYRLAFHPLLPLLGKTRRVFLAPDGQLALVPFAALHDGHQFLVDAFDFTYVSSGKDLLARPQETVPASSVVVLADPDFNAPPQPPGPATDPTQVETQRSTSVERFRSSLREDSVHRAWATAPLPGTRHEAEAIQHLLPQAQLFLGPEATKQRLLQLPTPGILHLATHGFFLEDAPVPKGSRGVVHFGALGEEPPGSRPPDPLLRSGLLLAGASAPTSSSPTGPPIDSALVTALELAGLNLWGTQLVVLSACDTGRGDVRLGQGVYGLRRAFLVAGAETVVMSLWKVNDGATHPLMEAYYRNLLAGQGRATALREAMRSFRRTYPHPHYWAPFITVGSDAPLRALAPGAPSLPDTKPTAAR